MGAPAMLALAPASKHPLAIFTPGHNKAGPLPFPTTISGVQLSFTSWGPKTRIRPWHSVSCSFSQRGSYAARSPSRRMPIPCTCPISSHPFLADQHCTFPTGPTGRKTVIRTEQSTRRVILPRCEKPEQVLLLQIALCCSLAHEYLDKSL